MAKTKRTGTKSTKEEALDKVTVPLPPRRQYLATFRPPSMIPETVLYATKQGANVLYRSETTFAAMVDDQQRQKIREFIAANFS